MKVIIVGGVAGGASCAARLRRLDEKAEIIMVERGPYVSYANCGLPYHISGVIEKESSLLVASEQFFRTQLSNRCADELRGDLDLGQEEDDRPSQRRDGRDDDGIVRQARALSGRGLGSPAAARHRPARHLRGEDGARRTGRPRMDRARHAIPRRHVQLLGHPVRAADAASRRHRRRLHRPRDGGEPDSRRIRSDAGRDARSAPGASRSRVRAPGRRAREAAWHAIGARRRRRGIRAAGRRRDRGTNQVRQEVSGGRRDPRPRRAARHQAREIGGTRDRRARRHSRRRAHAHQRPEHLRRRRRRRSARLRDGRTEPRRTRRACEPPGAHRRRRDRRTRVPLPRHAGHFDHRIVRRRGGMDGREREDA